jgi:hypothetical protein
VKIGNLYLDWRTPRDQYDARQAVLAYLRSDPEARGLAAKMARSEVKNYLAELAEQADIPFASAVEFLAVVKELLAGAATTGTGLQEDGTYDASADSPFSAFDHVEVSFAADIDGTPFCQATPEGASWPVCALNKHDDDNHESADYRWAGSAPAVLKRAEAAAAEPGDDSPANRYLS